MGTVWLSRDAINWQTGHIQTQLPLRDIAFGSGQWIAVEGRARGQTNAPQSAIFISADATNWTEVQVNLPGALLFDVGFEASIWRVVGNFDYGTNRVGTVLASTDGYTWTTQTPVGTNSIGSLTSLAGRWFLTASWSPPAGSDNLRGTRILGSLDGFNWEVVSEFEGAVTGPPVLGRSGWMATGFFQFVRTGSGGLIAVRTRKVFISSDGTQWTEKDVSQLDYSPPRDLAYWQDNWILIGEHILLVAPEPDVPPRLRIGFEQETLVVTWSLTAAGYQLQTSHDVLGPYLIAPFTVNPVLTGYRVNLIPEWDQGWFRLALP